jgi:hypothetical protein
MIFFDGLPRDVGATDLMDSARLAGMMVLVGHPLAPDLTRYVKLSKSREIELVRNPLEAPANNPHNFSRDQLVPLVAGLYMQAFSRKRGPCRLILKEAKARFFRAQNWQNDDGSRKLFGGDFLSPSVMNHLRLCAGQPSTWLGRMWLRFDILFNAIFTPMREPNQLIAMCIVAGPKYVKMYKEETPEWRDAILAYWSTWRGEPELAEMLIKKLEAYDAHI